jgi:hypothetical protein
MPEHQAKDQQEQLDAKLHESFSSTRVHEDQSSGESLGALAFAQGNDVDSTGRAPDLHTAAHEAAHVVQQRSIPDALKQY